MPHIQEDVSNLDVPRVLVSHGRLSRFSYGPLTLEEDRIKTSCVEVLSRIFSAIALRYDEFHSVPRLDPTLIASLARLGESNVGRVIYQIREEVRDLTLNELSSSEAVRCVEGILSSTVTDIVSRVDYIIHQKIYATLSAGGTVEGYTLEPVRYADEWDEGAQRAREAQATQGEGAHVIPLRRDAA